LAVLTVAFALPATKKLLPMAKTGAKSNNTAEWLRAFLCTMFSSHHCRPTLAQFLRVPARSVPPPHRRIRYGTHIVVGSKLLRLLLLQYFCLSTCCLGARRTMTRV
jgi:hypothetical protein